MTSPVKYSTMEFLDAMFGPDDLIEMRAIEPVKVTNSQTGKEEDRRIIHAGYYDAQHRDDLIYHAGILSDLSDISGVYYTINHIQPSLLFRSRFTENKYHAHPQTTSDRDTTSRNVFFIDVDPQRISGCSATTEEKSFAEAVANKVFDYLTSQGWPEPIRVDSGNGYHLLYKTEDNISTSSKVNGTVFELALKALSARFSCEHVKIDTGVFNPSRIAKLPNTMARKGANMPTRPWRMAEVLDIPESIGRVTLDQIRSLAALAPLEDRQATERRNEAEERNGPPPEIQMHEAEYLLSTYDDLISERGRTNDKGMVLIHLNCCPFNDFVPHSGDPDKTSLFVGGQHGLGFHCLSDDCSDKTIGDLRRLLSSYDLSDEMLAKWGDAVDFLGSGATELETEELAARLEASLEIGQEVPETSELTANAANVIPEAGAPIPALAQPLVFAAPVKPSQPLVLPDPYPLTEEQKQNDGRGTQSQKEQPVPSSPLNEAPHNEPFRLDIPEAALYGWLGDRARELQAPLSFAYTSMLTLFAGKMGPRFCKGGIRPTLYTALMAKPEIGKSLTTDRARMMLNMGSQVCLTVFGSDRALQKAFEPKEKLKELDVPIVFSKVAVHDEMRQMMSKMEIQNSALATLLCSLWSKDEIACSDKMGDHRAWVQLSYLGALKVDGISDFSQCFGASTLGGLYSRFVFVPGPLQWRWDHSYQVPVYDRRPGTVDPGFDGLNYKPLRDAVRRWVESEPDRNRGRLGEIACRVALISASANEDKIFTPEGIAAAITFAEWQEAVRARYKAGVARTLDAQLTAEILSYFTHPVLIGRWHNLRAAIKKLDLERKYGPKVMQAVRALVQSGSLEAEYMTGEDGKLTRKPTGFLRAPDENTEEE